MNISDVDHAGYTKAHSDPNSAFNRSVGQIEANQAEWVDVEGVQVLRVKDSNYVAAPCSGRKNAARFNVINLDDRTDVVCQLSKTEVRGWLTKTYISQIKTAA